MKKACLLVKIPALNSLIKTKNKWTAIRYQTIDALLTMSDSLTFALSAGLMASLNCRNASMMST
jgi:hypothetical protein